MPKTIKADGKTYVVPDDATDEEINQIIGPGDAAPQGWTDQLGDAASHFWGALKGAADPHNGVMGLMRALDNTGEELKAAKESMQNGDHDMALAHVVRAVPILGPFAKATRENLTEGHYGAAIGDTAGLLAVQKAAEALPKVIEKAPDAVRAVSSAVKAGGKDVGIGAVKVGTGAALAKVGGMAGGLGAEVAGVSSGLGLAKSGVKQMGRGIKAGYQAGRDSINPPVTATPPAEVPPTPAPTDSAPPPAPQPVSTMPAPKPPAPASQIDTSLANLRNKVEAKYPGKLAEMGEPDAIPSGTKILKTVQPGSALANNPKALQAAKELADQVEEWSK